MSTSRVRTDELDFESIRNNLKDFLRSKPEFTDYNFEGSAFSVLLDVLAYNTHQNALYANLVANESFLDSASKYSSVVSLAKNLGYTAKSARCARARLQVIVSGVSGNPETLTMPRGTTFRGNQLNSEFQFITLEDVTANRLNSVYTFQVDVVEGSRINRTIAYNQDVELVIPSTQADLSTLEVLVQTGTDAPIRYPFASDVLEVKATDPVYFIKQREDLFYQVFFGDDKVGRSVPFGATVRLAYNVSSGMGSNGIFAFTYTSGFRDDVSYNISAIQVAQGAADPEDIESIRFNAPRAYIAQGRAVTSDDYSAVILQNYPNVESVKSWGGQDNFPAVFGKVFIAVKPFGATRLNSDEKANILNGIVRSRNVVSVTPEIVDPKYLNIELNTSVYYNQFKTTRTAGQIETIVRTIISQYAANLNRFDVPFRFSNLVAQIDSVEPSIVSNITTFRIRTEIEPSYSILGRYEFAFENPIQKNVGGGGFYSTRFFTSEFSDRCYLTDDGDGNVILVTETEAGEITIRDAVGTVDYGRGLITVPELRITTLRDPIFEFVIFPDSLDVVPVRDLIVSLPSNLTTVNMIVDSVASGSSNTNFTFTRI